MILISRSVCFSMAFAAVEVYPTECVGSLFTDDKGKKICGITVYQLAKRSKESVSSDSVVITSKFNNLGFKPFCEFHSHTYDGQDILQPIAPSAVDLEYLECNKPEFIIQIRKSNKKKDFWENINGQIRIGAGTYRILIGAFYKVQGEDPKDFLYNMAKIKLVK